MFDFIKFSAVYAVIGMFVGIGPFSFTDWQWWIMDAILILSLIMHDTAVIKMYKGK
jgi:hypothetical protein